MNEIERRIKEFGSRLSQWWNSNSKAAKQRRADRSENLRRGATARAQRAAGRMQDFRQSERGQRAESALHDLRESGAAKRAEAALNDLRASDAGRRAESALADLRQREPVKKAEEGARKAMHDLFSGGPGNGHGTGTSA